MRRVNFWVSLPFDSVQRSLASQLESKCLFLLALRYVERTSFVSLGLI